MKENWETHWKDYYQILQVDPSAEPEVIKAAHDKLALKYHPDVNKTPNATQRMKVINEAYEILGDAEKRKRYRSAFLQHMGYSESSNVPSPSAHRPQPPSAKPKPEVHVEKFESQDLQAETKNYKILRVTDEHMNEFINGTNPAVQEKDVALLEKCEIYRYDMVGNITSLAFPNGKQDGFHNKVEVLDSKIAIFYVDEEIRKIRENKALNEGNKGKITWVLNAELKRLDDDLKSLNESPRSDRNAPAGDVIFGQSLKEQINELRAITVKIRDNKSLSEDEKNIIIGSLNRQYESVYLSYCGLINSFPYKTKKASDRYIDDKTGNTTG